MKLKIGDTAPSIQMMDSDGNAFTIPGSNKIVLYFYPKDNTAGCTKEACNFRDQWSAYETHGIKVLGVSGLVSTDLNDTSRS